MIVIVDSGSTKCDWVFTNNQGDQLFEKVRTKGMNPAILSKSKIQKILKASKTLFNHKNAVEHLYFYGAGCGTDKPKIMLESILKTFFSKAYIEVNEDTLAAVYATIDGHQPAVVCIMGTGSNCCYYDGSKLHQRVKSLGYSLMDDASGNYFGKQLIKDYYFRHMPENLRIALADEYNMDSDFIKHNLYKQPNPNAFLASFAKFAFLNKDSTYIREMLRSGIREFAKNMIMQFKEELKTSPVHFAGTIAFLSQNEIREVAAEFGFEVGNFVRRPIEGLVKYHVNEIGNSN